MAVDDQAMSSPAGPQSAALLSSLNSQREHILGILEGLSEQELRRPVRLLLMPGTLTPCANLSTAGPGSFSPGEPSLGSTWVEMSAR